MPNYAKELTNAPPPRSTRLISPPVHMLGINVVLVQEGGQLLPLSLREAHAQRAERIKDDLAEDEVRGLRARYLLSRREHLLPR